MSGKAVIDSVEKNVARLIDDNRRLRGEVERLTVSKDKLSGENRRLAQQLADVDRRLAVKELAGGFRGEATDRRGVKIARARVNRLLREVDKCIGLLNMES